MLFQEEMIIIINTNLIVVFSLEVILNLFDFLQMDKVEMADDMFQTEMSINQNNTAQTGDGGGRGGAGNQRGRNRRRFSVAQAVEGWGAATPFDSLSDYMMEQTLPVCEERTGGLGGKIGDLEG